MAAFRGAPVDTMLYLLRDDDSLVTFTEQRNVDGVSVMTSGLSNSKTVRILMLLPNNHGVNE